MMMHEIDKYMIVAEAAERWGLPIDTVKNKLKPSVKGTWTQTEKMIEEGLLKYYQNPGKKQKIWIISMAAMEKWFGENKNNL